VYNVFFEKEEIASTLRVQQMDAFEDIKEVKSQLLMQGDPTIYNKISIEEYMPKEPVKEGLLRKKTGRIRTSNNDEALDDQL
jgi:hypothetical protein